MSGRTQQPDHPLDCSRLAVALSWDRDGVDTDVDLQAVAFNDQGQIMDAVYYNNMKAFKGGLTHSGDESTGEKTGFDEFVWVNFGKMPADVKVIVFVVACYSGGHLRNVPNGKFHLLENSSDNEVLQGALENSEEEVDVLGLVLRGEDNRWVFRQIEVEAGDGQHFVDILEPTIGDIVRGVIPTAPRRIKACFAMDKGSLVDLPKTSEIKSIRIGLGWDPDPSAGNMDLDVAAVLLQRSGEGCVREYSTVFFGNLEASGVKHSGDSLTGEGSGDDETIIVELENVNPLVQQVAFVINIYTKGNCFSQVRTPYARVLTMDGEVMAQYKLSDAGRENGLVVARLLRAPDGVRWSFQAVGQPCGGQVYKDSLPRIFEICGKTAKDLQLRQLSTGSLDAPSAVAASAPAAAAAPPPAQEGSSACILQ